MLLCILTNASLYATLQKEEEAASKLYAEFVESFGDEPEQKASQRSFTRGGIIQPGSSASGAGVCKPPQMKAIMFLPCPQPMQSAGCITLVSAMQDHLAKRSLANMSLLSSHLPWQPQ